MKIEQSIIIFFSAPLHLCDLSVKFFNSDTLDFLVIQYKISQIGKPLPYSYKPSVSPFLCVKHLFFAIYLAE